MARSDIWREEHLSSAEFDFMIPGMEFITCIGEGIKVMGWECIYRSGLKSISSIVAHNIIVVCFQYLPGKGAVLPGSRRGHSNCERSR